MKTINNDIQEKRVGVDNARLLKEKGFDIITDLIYMTNHTSIVLFDNVNGLRHSDGNNPFISAPTHQLAIDWIFENFGFVIWSEPIVKKDSIMFFYYIRKYKISRWTKLTTLFTTPEEAKDAAINYVLTTLL